MYLSNIILLEKKLKLCSSLFFFINQILRLRLQLVTLLVFSFRRIQLQRDWPRFCSRLRINSLISFVEKEWNRAPGLFLHAGYGRSKRRPACPLNERVLVSSLALCDSAIVIMGTSVLSACHHNYRSVKTITHTRKKWMEQDTIWRETREWPCTNYTSQRNCGSW